MSGVRQWTRFLRAALVGIGVLVLGVGAFRIHVIVDPSVALWPTFDLLHVGTLESPLTDLIGPAIAQFVIWTSGAYLVFAAVDGLRRSLSSRP